MLVQISVYDILVGDVLHLEAGDLIPVDGILISGHRVKCDESSTTGESDQIKKTPGDEVMTQIEAGASPNKLDPFIISGSKVLEGVGTYLVTGVGVNSSYGKLMLALTSDTEATPTPLQTKLSIVAEQIAILGCAVALLLFIVLFIKFLVQLKGNQEEPAQKAQNFLQIVIVCITIIVIAVPEGLPLAVTLALAFAMTRMLKDGNLVRVLSSCETMGNATAICSDKTGTLTMNKMTVVAGTLGIGCRFGKSNEAVNRDQGNGEQAASGQGVYVSISVFASSLPGEVRRVLIQSIAINSTAFEGKEDGQQIFIGSKTETALLSFAKEHLGMGPVGEERANAPLVQMFPFDSGRKCMASVIRLSDGIYRMYVKGASELLLDKCTWVVADATKSLKRIALTKGNYKSLTNIMDNYAANSLRTISIVYRDFRSWPPLGAETVEGSPKEAEFEDVFKEMVFLSVVGIQDPLRPGVKEAVAQCKRAGVFVRMVTGDNVGTAKAIAAECGIYTPGGVIIQGPEFRKLSTNEMDLMIPHLQVLARSSPEDKKILVRRLKEQGEIVAVTGDGTNDGPALRMADVGFSMGIAGTEVAKEASSIILMDDNFSSIIKALEWGRAVNDAVKKFLQVGVSYVVGDCITFSADSSGPLSSSNLPSISPQWVLRLCPH
jgi:Ca2+-transporting ATPase